MRNRLNKRRSRRRSSIKSFRSGNAGPLFKLLGVVFGSLLGLALLAFCVMFALEAFFKVDTPLNASGIIGKFAGKINTPLIETPSPVPTEEPTPTPHPMDDFDPAEFSRELIMPSDLNYPWLADPYYHSGTVICSAGKLSDGKVKLDKLVSCELKPDFTSGAVSELEIKPVNDHLIYPAFNEKWLVYFDANYEFGGGEIRYVDRTASRPAPKTIKKVYIGQPEIKLDGDYIAWIERTGSEREKIFICDLSTEETAVVDFFDFQASGTSMPYLSNGKLVWAAPASMNDSTVKSLDIKTGTITEFRPGLFVHDPKYNGQHYVWLDSPHADGAKLYGSDGVSGSFEIAEDVIDFCMDELSVIYSKDDALFVYSLFDKQNYRLTAETESAQLLGASGSSVIFWMDVTSRERDIIKYMFNPLIRTELHSENEG